jgi:hypothetical protein
MVLQWRQVHELGIGDANLASPATHGHACCAIDPLVPHRSGGNLD